MGSLVHPVDTSLIAPTGKFASPSRRALRLTRRRREISLSWRYLACNSNLPSIVAVWGSPRHDAGDSSRGKHHEYAMQYITVASFCHRAVDGNVSTT